MPRFISGSCPTCVNEPVFSSLRRGGGAPRALSGHAATKRVHHPKRPRSNCHATKVPMCSTFSGRDSSRILVASLVRRPSRGCGEIAVGAAEDASLRAPGARERVPEGGLARRRYGERLQAAAAVGVVRPRLAAVEPGLRQIGPLLLALAEAGDRIGGMTMAGDEDERMRAALGRR